MTLPSHYMSVLPHLIDNHFLTSVTDTHGVILQANDKFCALSEYSRYELIGKPHNIIRSQVHPAEFFASFWKTIKSGEVWHGEICNRAKSGRLYWVDSFVMPCTLSSGEKGYISIRYNITELKKLQSATNQQAEMLRIKNERLSHIGFSLAHEIRPAIANILGVCESVDHNTIPADSYPRILNLLKSQAQKTDGILTTIMESAAASEIIKETGNV